MIKIAVCDDEKNMRSELTEQIAAFIDKFGMSYQILSFANAKLLIDSNDTYDIIFLDIQMDELNGLEAARIIREAAWDSFIVFVTVLKECVYDAFEVEATDYLLKPVDDDRLTRTMNRIIRYIEERENNSLTIKKGVWCKCIRFADILYCEAVNRKIYVHTKQGVIDYYGKIEELEKQLNKGFFKCHRSYMVNLQHVYGCENGMAQLENGENIPISRLRQQDFIQAVMCYMKDR